MSRWNHLNQGFKKGHTTNVGRNCSLEKKRKIGKSNSGKILYPDAIVHRAQKCLFCGNEFYRKVGQKFCSNNCRFNFLKKISRIKKECIVCQKEFFVILARRERARFCSKRCHVEFSLGRKSPTKGIKRPQSSGKNHPRWIEDRTQLQKYNDDNLDRRSSAYGYWRLQVYKRDNYKCKINNQDCKGRLEAHHILSWINFPELRYEINNGITLCQTHHPRKRVEEKSLIPIFMELISPTSKVLF